ncbi:MAG TPA: FISUMP domain-containing protein [Bryobacteraceae bacterium]
MMRVVTSCVASIAMATMAACGGVASKRMADGKRWTVRNLDVETEGSYCYNGNCRQYGRLYTWESARLACQSLGHGWRLPTEEDWRQLAARYGGEAYRMLLVGGDSGFGALLGGDCDLSGQFTRLEAHGFYWTATEDGPASAVFYNFAKGKLSVFEQSTGEKPRAFSVRCVAE